MEFLIGLAVGALIFGVYYLIGTAISKKIFYGNRFKYLLGTVILFVLSLLIISAFSGVSFEEIMGTQEAYFYYAAIVFGSYYGLKNSDVIQKSDIQQNS